MATTESKKDRLITPIEALERLGLSQIKDPVRTVSKMGGRGELQVRYVGKFLRVVESSVDKIIAGSK